MNSEKAYPRARAAIPEREVPLCSQRREAQYGGRWHGLSFWSIGAFSICFPLFYFGNRRAGCGGRSFVQKLRARDDRFDQRVKAKPIGGELSLHTFNE